MPCVIRKYIDGRFSDNLVELAPHDSDLPPQFAALESWLRDHRGELDQAFGWVADVGFTPRPGAMGGGPVISVEFMRMCVEACLVIHLSEYSVEA